MAFPCNQFGQQEPGPNEEIKTFATSRYGASYVLMDKIDVNGENTSPLYRLLKEHLPGDIRWNFEKFLIRGSDGVAVKRFPSSEEPMSSVITSEIEKLLES